MTECTWNAISMRLQQTDQDSNVGKKAEVSLLSSNSNSIFLYKPVQMIDTTHEFVVFRCKLGLGNGYLLLL